jgi:hypothetical protein
MQRHATFNHGKEGKTTCSALLKLPVMWQVKGEHERISMTYAMLMQNLKFRFEQMIEKL